MINRIIEALEKLSIEFVVAPYEANARFAYMCWRQQIDFVIKMSTPGEKKSTDEEEIPERENFEKKDSPDFRIEKYFEENFDESFEAENKNLDENSREEKGDKSEN